MTENSSVLDYGKTDDRTYYNYRDLVLTHKDYTMNIKINNIAEGGPTLIELNNTQDVKLICSNCRGLRDDVHDEKGKPIQLQDVPTDILRYYNKRLNNYTYIYNSLSNLKTNKSDCKLNTPNGSLQVNALCIKGGGDGFDFSADGKGIAMLYQNIFVSVSCTKDSDLPKCDEIAKSFSWSYKTY